MHASVALAGVGAVSVIEAASADIATISRVVCFALKLMSPFSLAWGLARGVDCTHDLA